MTPSNTYLEISFENQNQAQPKKQQQQQSPQKILPSQVYNSTPNGKVRTITQVWKLKNLPKISENSKQCAKMWRKFQFEETAKNQHFRIKV